MIPSGCRVHLPVPSPTSSAFPKSSPWVGFLNRPAKRLRAAGVSRSSPFLTFRPPGLLATQVSPTAAPRRPQGSRDFSTRANHASLPMHASGMLAVRIRQLTAVGLSPPKTCSLVGRYPGVDTSPTDDAALVTERESRRDLDPRDRFDLAEPSGREAVAVLALVVQ